MDIWKYIEDGNLEQYCLDVFNPALQTEIFALSLKDPRISQELDEIESAIEQLSANYAVIPADRVKDQVLAALNFTAHKQQLDMENLPPTNRDSDYLSWLGAVERLIPRQPFDDFFMHILQQNEQLSQLLVVTKLDVPQETHADEVESFFILEGRCKCTIGKEVFELSPGDFLDIPLHMQHDVKLLSPYVIAVLQHQKVGNILN